MYKFIFEDEDRPCPYGITDPYHTKRIEFQVKDNSNLDEMLDAFENFLKANGYHFDGNLDIVPEHSFDETVSNSIDDATPEEWNQAYKNVKVTYK
jgi:hypothetical protein